MTHRTLGALCLLLAGFAFGVAACGPAGIAAIGAGSGGNSGPPDTAAPKTRFSRTPSAFSNRLVATFEFDAERGATFEGRLDGGEWKTIESPHEVTLGGPDRKHTFEVRAKDLAGNLELTPASFTWTVDTGAPLSPENLLPTPMGADSIQLEWDDGEDTGTGIAGYRVYFDTDATGPPYDGRQSDQGASPVTVGLVNQLRLTGLAVCQPHAFNVTAVDRAGNESAFDLETEFALRTGCGPAGRFAEPIGFPLGDGATPRSVTTADFDADGIQDLLVVNAGDPAVPGSSNLTILRGGGAARRGDGTFAEPPLRFDTGGRPAAAAVGDLNGDRILDVVAVNEQAADVRVLLGNGTRGRWDRTFTGPIVYATTIEDPRAVLIGEFFDDGEILTDIAVAGAGFGDTLALLQGLPDGSFLQRVRIDELSVGQLSSLAAWRGLGLIATSPDRGVAWTLQTGILRRIIIPYAIEGASSVVPGDFDNDGIEDFAVASAEFEDVGLFIGNERRAFSSPTFFEVGERPQSLVTGDFDGDRILDVATAEADDQSDGDDEPDDDEAGRVSLLLGQGLNGRGTGVLRVVDEFPAGRAPGSIATADVNADRIPDLIVTNRDDDAVSVLLGEGATRRWNGTFAPPFPTVTSFFPEFLVVHDRDSDGILDLAILHRDPIGTVSLWKGAGSGARGTGVFTETGTLFVGDADPVAFDAGDLDGDGIDDFAVAYRTNEGVSDNLIAWLGNGRLGVGDGTYSDPPFRRGLQIGPIDSIAVGPFGVALARGRTIEVVPFQGGFGVPQSYDTGLTINAELRAGDLDGDGIPDLAVVGDRFGTGEVAVCLGQGDGSFVCQPTRYDSLFLGERTLHLDDLDRDGIRDVMVGTIIPDSRITVFFGRGSRAGGDWRLERARSYPTGAANLDAITTGDFDQNGIPDLVATSAGTGLVSVLLALTDPDGRVTGRFGAPRTFDAGPFARDVETGDFDADGIVDIVVTNFELPPAFGFPTFSVLFGVGPRNVTGR